MSFDDVPLWAALIVSACVLLGAVLTFVGALGNLAMSFVCGPYIMLQLGWQHEEDGTLSMTSALVSAVVAFGWAFITGLLFMGAYVAIRF